MLDTPIRLRPWFCLLTGLAAAGFVTGALTLAFPSPAQANRGQCIKNCKGDFRCARACGPLLPGSSASPTPAPPGAPPPGTGRGTGRNGGGGGGGGGGSSRR